MKLHLVKILSYALFFASAPLIEKATWEFSLPRYVAPGAPSAQKTAFPAHQTWVLEAKGGQSLVFFSEDGQYVLKFFQDQPRPYHLLPSYRARKAKKLARTLNGYTLLHELCPHLSATVLNHFQKTVDPLPARLIDRLGIAHDVDLSAYLFVLQKRAAPLERVNPQELETLINTLASSHLQDHDHRLSQNLGLLDGTLVILDPGRIAEAP